MDRRLALLLPLTVTAIGCATRNMNKAEYFQYLEDREAARAEPAQGNPEKDAEWAREDARMDRADAIQDRSDARAASTSPRW